MAQSGVKRKAGAAGSRSAAEKPPSRAPAGTDAEDAFPRGGADALTPLERRQIVEEARQALELEAAASSGITAPAGPHGGGKKRRTLASTDHNKARHGKGFVEEPFLGGERDGKGPVSVPLLSAKRLSPGTRLLAMVLEVSPGGLTLSLPHGLRGHVTPPEASDVLARMLDPASKSGAVLREALGDSAPPSLAQLFQVGQYVRTAVLGNDTGCEADTPGVEEGRGAAADGGGQPGGGRRIIRCTLRLSVVCAGRGLDVVQPGVALPAVVRSVEDHGYTLDLGIKGVKGFLPKDDYQASHGSGAAALPGALLEVVVSEPPGPRGVVRVASDPTAAAAALLSDADPTGLTSLLPGALVNAKVTAVARDGLHVKLLGVLAATVDALHLGPGLAAPKAFKQDQKLKARVLYVDPNAKAIGLSLLPHILSLALPAPIPSLGQVFEAAPVTRVDEGLGLMVALPLGGELGGTCPAFCHVSNASDERLARLGAAFKAGTSTLRCRVIGFRLVDGLAAVSAKTADLEQQVLSYKDVAPGQVLGGTVVRVDAAAGLVVQVAPHIRALVPVAHMSDLGKETARKKFKVGQAVTGKVWAVDAAARKLVLTLKPALLGSKLPPITSPETAVPGSKSHGVVTGVTKQGVFVSFYNGTSGLAAKAELGLPQPTDDPAALFNVGQVVRARVLAVDAASGRIRLSLRSGAAAAATTPIAGSGNGATPADPCGGLQPGDIVEGRVVRVEAGGDDAAPSALLLEVHAEGKGPTDAAGPVAARLDLPGHLADHPAAVAALLPLMARAGAVIGPLVVLERHEAQKQVLVSRKTSLVAAGRAGRLPTAFSQIKEGLLAAGFVGGVTADAVFVRFAGHVTGRAGLSQLADTFVSDARSLFSVGQSVRAQVVTVDDTKQRFSVTLRPSINASTDAAYVASLYADLELAAAVKAGLPVEPGADPELHDADWARLAPGCVVAGAVDSTTDFGLLVDVVGVPDVVGVVRPHHQPAGTPTAKGAALTSRVLDVSKLDHILDLTLKPSLVTAAGKPPTEPTPRTKTGKRQQGKGSAGKGAQPEGGPVSASAADDVRPGLVVDAVVELLKDAPEYTAVLSIPSLGSSLVHVAATDFNAATPSAVRRQLRLGETVRATLQVLPGASTGGRMLGAVNLASAPPKASSVPHTKLAPGAVVTATVKAIVGDHAELAIGPRLVARLHATEVADLPAPDALLAAQALASSPPPAKKAKAAAEDVPRWVAKGESPLEQLREGQEVKVVVLPRPKRAGPHGHANHHGGSGLDVTLRPSVLAAVASRGSPPSQLSLSDLTPGQAAVGVVAEVTDDAAWVALSPHVRGRLHILTAASEPNALAGFREQFPIGRVVHVHIAHKDEAAHTLDLSVLPLSGVKVATAVGQHRIVSSAAIAHAAGSKHGRPPAAGAGQALKQLLQPGSVVMGRVAGLGGAAGGLRVHIGGPVHGRVALTDIHDAWVPNALTGVEDGAFVRAAVLAVDAPDTPGSLPRVALSLRPSRGGAIAGVEPAVPVAARAAAPGAGGRKRKGARVAIDDGQQGGVRQACPETLSQSSVGQAVRGYIKRSDAKSGVFVTLDRHHDARIKLCNLSDGYIEDPGAAFPAGLLVEGRLVGVEGSGASQRLEMSLRAAHTRAAALQVSDFTPGQLVQGVVRRVEPFGVFVELAGSPVVGLAHISELSDAGKVKDVHSLFRAQQSVTARVLGVDAVKKQISLTLKPSAVAEGEEMEQGNGSGRPAAGQGGPVDLDEEMADDAMAGSGSGDGEDSDDGDADDASADDEGEASSSDDDEDASTAARDGQGDGNGVSIDDMDSSGPSEEDEDGAGSQGEDDDSGGLGDDGAGDAAAHEAALAAGAQLRQRLAGAAGLPNGAATDADAFGGLLVVEDLPQAGSLGADEGQEGRKEGKASKAARKREAAEAERKIREAELARLRGEDAPQSAADFERAVLGSPNSSYTWIRYMAWLLGLGETDKARAVAQRALDTIHYREEGEKLNVWVAWLNLEAAYGTPSPEEALATLFQKALQYCDPKKVYFALLGITQRHSMAELEASTLKAMCKRFHGSAKVWLRAVEAALQRGDGGEQARTTLQRALQALPQRKHIKVITGVALLEFRQGSMERGRGMLEGVLRNYPKRLDLWSLYIDQEVKAGDEGRTRALFERATSLTLPPRKMKSIFKRWLDWEKRVGGPVDRVKQRAMEFVACAAQA